MYRQIKVFILTVLFLGLMGCAAKLPTVIKLYPPAELLQDCLTPTYVLATNGDLATGIVLGRNALALCNIDKAALREWASKE